METVRIERRDLAHTIAVPGSVRGYETADLHAKVSGYLDEISVDLGDTVSKGQELARLHIPEMQRELRQKEALIEQAEADVAQAQAAIRQAEAQVASAEASLDESKAERAEKQAQLRYRQAEHRRYEELGRSVRKDLLDEAKFQLEAAEAGVSTVEARIRTATSRRESAQADLERAQADYKSAQARVEVARADYEYVETMLEYATIRAPFDGRIMRRWVDPGAFVQSAEGTGAKPLLQVVRTDVVRIFLDLPMAEVGRLNRGDRVVLDRINALPGEVFEGEVTRFSAGLDQGSRMMRVEIDLENPDHRLRPGFYGYATLYLEEYPASPVAPSSALIAEGGTRFVYVCENGRAHKREVVPIYEDGTWVGIGDGLSGGEQIIRAGGGQISDGQPVVAVLSQEENDSP